MLFYIALTITIYLLSRRAEKKNDKKYVFFSLLILILVFSLRGRTVGTDLENVLTLYEKENFRWTEWGYGFLGKTIRLTGSNTLFLFVLSMIIYCPLFLGLWENRDSGSYAVSVLVFMLLFYNSTLNIMRQWVAVSIVFFGLRYLKSGSYLKYLVTNTLAVLFHTSAIICLGYLVFDLILSKRLRLKKTLLAAAFVMVLMVGLMRYFGDFFNGYLIDRTELYLSEAKGSVGLFNIAMLLIITAVCCVFWHPQFFSKNSELKEQRFIFAFVCTLCGYLLIWLGYFYPNMERISYYYYVYQIVLIGNLFKRIRLSRQPVLTKRLCQTVVFLPLVYYYVSGLLGNANGVIPYTVFWIS